MKTKIQLHDFRVPAGKKKVDLEKWPTLTKPVYDSKKEYHQLLRSQVKDLAELQRLHYAANRYSVLLIFQAMDAAGKDGAVRHVMSGVNPQGCQVFVSVQRIAFLTPRGSWHRSPTRRPRWVERRERSGQRGSRDGRTAGSRTGARGCSRPQVGAEAVSGSARRRAGHSAGRVRCSETHRDQSEVAVAQYGVDPADSELAAEIAKALEEIANDTRPGVRAAAAYVAGTLVESTDSTLRALAPKLAELAADPYVQVSREAWFGQRRSEAEGGRRANA